MQKVKMYLKDEFGEETIFIRKIKDSPRKDIEELYYIFKEFLASVGYAAGSVNNICYVTKEEDDEIKAKIGYGIRE